MNQPLHFPKKGERDMYITHGKRIITLLLIAFLFLFYSSTRAQSLSPKSYALVIGVSKYLHITPSLNFAHIDAEKFAELCASPSGLNIPPDRLKVLINEQATYLNIMNGLDWLKNNAQMGDQIYIYFAGHGAMESTELKYGYLLLHETRKDNFLGWSLSLDLLNKTANTMSIDKKAKVFLITDACHSGKQSGIDFNHSNLLINNLIQKVEYNEVRIMSCNEGEVSYEGKVWDNGRGAFSYFLIKGMKGEADGVSGKKDGKITVEEIQSFLGKNVSKSVKTLKKKNQNPVVKGLDNVVLNTFVPTSNSQSNTVDLSQSNDNSISEGSRSIATLPDNALEEDIIKSIDSNPDTIFADLSTKVDSVILYKLLEKLPEERVSKDLLTSAEISILVAKILYEKVRLIINMYLDGDEAELEKRRFDRQVDKPYEQYPYMVDIAIKLLPEGHILIPSLKMTKEYLKGLAFRLKVPFTEDYMVLIDSANVAQQKALAIDSTAAYIHNEIGILSLYKKDYDLAKHHFNRAIIIAPSWSLPYSNLANLYQLTKEHTLAKKYVNVALEKQKNLQSPYLIDGDLYVEGDNLLFAEEQFQKAIKLNDRYYYPFEKLGLLYLSTQDYIEADKYFFEADSRKLREVAVQLPHAKNITAKMRLVKTCEIDSLLVSAADVMAHFVVGKGYFDKKKYEQAQKWFEKVVTLDVGNPLVYHYLGQTAYYFKSYDKAEFYFNRSIDLYMESSTFEKHLSEEALKSQYYQRFKDSCLFATYEKSHFELYDSKLFLAKTYEKWKNYTNAIEVYNECIDLKPKYRVAFYMLWNMYKYKNDLESAENAIQRFGKNHPDLLDDVLADFYKWVMNTFSEDVQKTEHYAYKYGLLMHNFIMKSPERDWGESLIITLDSEEKDFPNDFNSFIFYPKIDEKERLVEEAIFITPSEIEKPLSTGVAMFDRVIESSIDKNVIADAYAKIGDFYYRAKSDVKAMENYEKSFLNKNDDIGMRIKVIDYADQRYLFQKALDYLKALNESNSLGFDGTIMLAKYYMKSGERKRASDLYDKIGNTHPFLKEKVKKDVIKLHLRFGDYQKAIELTNQHIASDTTDMTFEYMLARAHAGLNKPEEALNHLKNAESLGFDLGSVYKNDIIFKPYRALNAEWTAMQEKMEGYITTNK